MKTLVQPLNIIQSPKYFNRRVFSLYRTILLGGSRRFQDFKNKDHPNVGVSTAGSLHTITLLPIPQGIIEKEFLPITSNIVTSLTVVVTANVGRNLSSTISIAGT